MKKSYIAVDIETTGLKPGRDEIIEIGAVKYEEGKIISTFSSFIKPNVSLPERIVSLTGITDDMLFNAKEESTVMADFLDFAEGEVILGHNVLFDFSFLKTAAKKIGRTFERKGIDTLRLARALHPEFPNKTLDYMCEQYGIVREKKHRAFDDAIAAARLYEHIFERFFHISTSAFDFEELFYEPKKQEPITAKQKKYLLDLTDYHKISLMQNIETLTKSEASRRIDKIILKHGMIPRR